MFVCPLTDLDPDEKAKSHCVNGSNPMTGGWGKRMTLVEKRVGTVSDHATPVPTPSPCQHQAKGARPTLSLAG